MDTLLLMQRVNTKSLYYLILDQHNLYKIIQISIDHTLKTNSQILVGNHYIAEIVINHSIDHEHHLFYYFYNKIMIPQIFIGAFKSSNTG